MILASCIFTELIQYQIHYRKLLPFKKYFARNYLNGVVQSIFLKIRFVHNFTHVFNAETANCKGCTYCKNQLSILEIVVSEYWGIALSCGFRGVKSRIIFEAKMAKDMVVV